MLIYCHAENAMSHSDYINLDVIMSEITVGMTGRFFEFPNSFQSPYLRPQQ